MMLVAWSVDPPMVTLKCPLHWQNTLNCPPGWLKHVNCPLGSQNAHYSALLGAKKHAKVPLFSPLPYKKSAHATAPGTVDFFVFFCASVDGDVFLCAQFFTPP